MIIQEGIDGVSKSGEFSNRKPVDRAKNTIRQKCQSSVRCANIAQQNVLMCETHRSLLRWQAFQKGGDREMVADCQSGRHQGGIRPAAYFVPDSIGLPSSRRPSAETTTYSA